MKIVVKKRGLIWVNHHFVVVADNNRVLCRSKKVTSEKDFLILLNRIKKFCETGIGLTIDIARNWRLQQKFHFRFIDDESNKLLWSENYHNEKDCRDAAELVRTGINTAKILGITL
jgi:uncharacterized protein YegP (UPF0339 family)